MPSNQAPSRRGFLGASAAVAASVAFTPSSTASAETTVPPPAPITALPVLSAQARPFTNAERLAETAGPRAQIALSLRRDPASVHGVDTGERRGRT